LTIVFISTAQQGDPQSGEVRPRAEAWYAGPGRAAILNTTDA